MLRTRGAVAELDQLPFAAVIDLEGCVVDLEALLEHLLEFAADRVTVVVWLDEHVRG